MKVNVIAGAIVLGSVIIGASIVLGFFILADTPEFVVKGTSLFDTRSGTLYTPSPDMDVEPPRPLRYVSIPGPGSPGVRVISYLEEEGQQ